MNDLIIPCVGDIWQDANGCHNLVLAFDEDRDLLTILTLETGVKWYQERLIDWNDWRECTAADGKPFYRVLVA